MPGALVSMFPAAEDELLSDAELNALATLMLPGLSRHPQPTILPDIKPSQPGGNSKAVESANENAPDEEPDEADPAYLQDDTYYPTPDNTLPIPAGYTYLCQFIAHDMVADSHFHIGGRATSPLLNLDSLYGTAGVNSGESASENAGAMLGNFDPQYFETTSGCFITQSFDVHRVAPGTISNAPWATAWMPEQRNDENVIVLQLHHLLQLLHNAFIGQLQKQHPLDITQRIIAARRYTQAVFHHLVINDLLPKLVMQECHDYFFNQQGSFYYSAQHPYTDVPAEFKLATFRFGHSMLRPRYHLTTEQSQSFSLDEIMRRPPFEPLDAIHRIDWPALFFDPLASEGLHQTASPIDVFITADMASVPHPTNPTAGRNIAQLNLLAGNKVKLNSAEQIIGHLRTQPGFKPFAEHFSAALRQRDVPLDSFSVETDFIYALLTVLQEQQRTPLWLYALTENLLDYADSNQYKLGLIASAINCDVLRSAMYECYRHSSEETTGQLATQCKTTIKQAFECIGAPLHTLAELTDYLTTRNRRHD